MREVNAHIPTHQDESRERNMSGPLTPTPKWRYKAAGLTKGLIRHDLRRPATGDWYTLKPFSMTYLAAESFFYVYSSYILLLMLLGALILRLTNPVLTFTQALFMSCSCVSQSGLSVVDWGTQPLSTHVASVFLILGGSMSLLSVAPICFRMNSYRLQRKALARKTRLSRCESDLKSSYWALNRESFFQSYGLEYEALQKILKIVLCHWLGLQLLGWFCLCIYFHLFHCSYADEFREWKALYMTISAFQNNGLTLYEDSVTSMSRDFFPLIIIMILILCGNTALPICVRCWTYIARACSRPTDRPAYDFLLKNPRRCYTHMFPSHNTVWLACMVVGLTGVLTSVILWQDRTSPTLSEHTDSAAVVNSLFQAVSTRTAGINSIDVSMLSMGSTFVMLVWMYIAASPTVVIMRKSAQNEVDGGGISSISALDIQGRNEGNHENAREEEQFTVKFQARRYFLQHSVYLMIMVFLILVLEKDNLLNAEKHSSQQDIYGDFGFFKVIFDVISAYGTVGFSLGVKGESYSFSGALTEYSQIIICMVMFLGRIRGLPDSIDSSVTSYHPNYVFQDAPEEL